MGLNDAALKEPAGTLARLACAVRLAEAECAVCLEPVFPNEWSCEQCGNLLHVTCHDEICASGTRACPYCRHIEGRPIVAAPRRHDEDPDLRI